MTTAPPAPAQTTASSPPRLVKTAWLTAAPAQTVLHALTRRGHRARIVGGAVRNALIGLPVRDIDIATDATPDDVIALAAEAHLKTVATGLAHGTVTVIADGVAFEVTTLRRDVETHGRHATVAFTNDWAADASRRDFTINALYCDADGTVFDPLHGYPDLMARRVRFVGDAGNRIAEDYLRILRFFRFSAEYAGTELDSEGLAACVAGRAGLGQLSAERVRAELMKLLVAPGAVRVVSTMYDHGLLQQVLGVAPNVALFERLVAIETARNVSPDPALRLGALTVAVIEDAGRIAERLRLSNAERDMIAASIWRDVAHLRSIDDAAARRQRYARGNAGLRNALLVAWAASGDATDQPRWRQLLDMSGDVSPQFPITGKDVIELGVAPGPHIGEVLRALESWWIANDFTDDRKLIEWHLAELLRRTQPPATKRAPSV